MGSMGSSMGSMGSKGGQNVGKMPHIRFKTDNSHIKRNQMNFEFEHVLLKEELIKQIDKCEGKHTQQAIYSTFHSGLTQVCFGCKKIRSTIAR
jgi:hypothetical protein